MSSAHDIVNDIHVNDNVEKLNLINIPGASPTAFGQVIQLTCVSPRHEKTF